MLAAEERGGEFNVLHTHQYKGTAKGIKTPDYIWPYPVILVFPEATEINRVWVLRFNVKT